MSDAPISDLDARYRDAQASFVELLRTLSTAQWSTIVPCTPEWTVRDVLSHVAGVPDDAFAGRMDGVTTDPWTAAQVERKSRRSKCSGRARVGEAASR